MYCYITAVLSCVQRTVMGLWHLIQQHRGSDTATNDPTISVTCSRASLAPVTFMSWKTAAVLSTSSFLQIPAESSLPSNRLIMSSTATAQKWLVLRSLAIVQPNLLSGECKDAVSLMGRWSQGSRQRWKTLRQKGGTSIMMVQQCSRAALGLSDHKVL